MLSKNLTWIGYHLQGAEVIVHGKNWNGANEKAQEESKDPGI